MGEPFFASFTDVRMRIVELVPVVARFLCSGTHTGMWLGHPATGRRFTDVAEVYCPLCRRREHPPSMGAGRHRDRIRQLGRPLA